MDRRAYIAAFVAILLLILLGRKRIVQLIRRAGLFNVVVGTGDEITLDQIEVPRGPVYKSNNMSQTTGLMCHCDGDAYAGPVFVREIEVPPFPYPRYIYQGAKTFDLSDATYGSAGLWNGLAATAPYRSPAFAPIVDLDAHTVAPESAVSWDGVVRNIPGGPGGSRIGYASGTA